ncbi:MAG: lysophospholipid acyltransferase family protein [Pseudomonadota bacterium]
MRDSAKAMEPAAKDPEREAAAPDAAPRAASARRRRRRKGPLRRASAELGARLVGAAAPRLLALYVWVIFRTGRWRYIGREHLEAMFAAPCFIASVWHGRLAPIAMLRPKARRAVALISASRDGAILGRVMAHLGAEGVFGSSRDPRKADKGKGGAAASQRAVAALKQGAILVITPDGPRGPRMRAKPGVAAIAAASEGWVLPVAFSARWATEFGSWDRFLAPWPFTQGVFVFGPPIAPPPKGDEAALARHRAAVEAAMIAATREADRAMGRETPEPGADPHAALEPDPAEAEGEAGAASPAATA